MSVETVDLAVIGGGPAGLTAALYAARGLRSTVIFERAITGGQISLTHLVENYPGFPEGVNGFDLSQAMQRQAERYGARFRFEEVRALARVEAGFRLVLDRDEVLARTVIVTAGAEY